MNLMLNFPKVSLENENLPKFQHEKFSTVFSPSSKGVQDEIVSPRKTLALSEAKRRRKMLEMNDVRELNSKKLSSINWTKHCHVKREQMPSKLRSCFLVTKCEIISKKD